MTIDMPFGTCEIVAAIPEALTAFIDRHSYTGVFILSDRNIFPLFGQTIMNCLQRSGLPIYQQLLDSGEHSKSLSSAESCWQTMHRSHLDRSTLVIGLGGGVITDLAGFVASCYMRGVDVIHLPTSLLGMVDASIGGKTGVNLSTGKNIVGSFYPPKRILITLDYLKELPDNQFRSGLAEVIKYGVIRDPLFFEYLEKHMKEILNRETHTLNHIISTSCSIKAEIVQEDEKELDLRAILNYGHTFAHALETLTEYQSFLHGEAVSIGMSCAAQASQLLGMVNKEFSIRQSALCHQAGLPTTFPKNLDIDQMIELMKGDKKSSAGKIDLILPERLGKVRRVKDVNPSLIRSALLAAQRGTT